MINVKTHIRALRLGIILPLFLFLFMVGITGSVSARSGACPDGSLYTNAPDNIPIEEICADHMQSNSNENEVNTFYVTPVNDCEDCISKDIELVINTLSVGVGVVAVAMIIIGGLQYTASRSDPKAVAAAKSKITNAVIGIVVYVLIYAFLQWLVPGGLF